MINISLVSKGNFPHLQQLYSGLNILYDKKVCNLYIRLANSDSTFDAALKFVEYGKPICFLQIDGVKVAVDTLDGYNFNDAVSFEENLTIMDKIADEVDLYFKRSNNQKLNGLLRNNVKVKPYGFNYQVNDDNRYIQRKLSSNSLKNKLLNVCPSPYMLGRRMKVEQFEQYPKFSSKDDCQILFMTRLWDNNAPCREDIRKQRETINKGRIEALIALKQEFGSHFFGGIFPNNMSEAYPDLVLSRFDTQKYNYIKRLMRSDICIATTGLHDSIGWKMAEYVAASKCIVSEPLHYTVTGDSAENVNYLKYTDTETLINQVHKLMSDHNLRYEMQVRNYRYYNEFLRPDSLVLNLIAKVKTEI